MSAGKEGIQDGAKTNELGGGAEGSPRAPGRSRPGTLPPAPSFSEGSDPRDPHPVNSNRLNNDEEEILGGSKD
jgi:hypothetical protein